MRADIVMQLDDVGTIVGCILLGTRLIGSYFLVSSMSVGRQLEEAMWRAIRCLNRCIQTHETSGKTGVRKFSAIVQGGLGHDLRNKCLSRIRHLV